MEPRILYLFGSVVVGLGLPIGALITKWASGTDDVAKRVHDEMLQVVNQQQEAELNALREQLEADGDARTEKMLEELRDLHQSFQEEAKESGWLGNLPISVNAEITDKVSELFAQAVQCLKDTLKMQEKSRNTQLQTIRKVLRQHREKLLSDVQQTIVQLAHLYTRVLTLEPDSNETELSRLRTELDESLDFAKKVDAQIREFTPDAADTLSQSDDSVADSHTMVASREAAPTEEGKLQ